MSTPFNESALRLSNDVLRRLPEQVLTPAYDRRALSPHTIHIGVGGFHRAHQALYLDDLLATDRNERWGEIGLGILPSDAKMRDALAPQDHLYTLLERDGTQQSLRVIGSLIKFILAPAAQDAAIEALASPETRIVSLTVTEGGYFLHEGTGDFTADSSEIVHDLQKPDSPVSWLGYVVEALQRRQLRGLPPFTVMSCDNLQSNGRVARKVLLAFAHLRDSNLERWIADHVSFPNSMVDRITPATTSTDIEQVSSYLGVADAWPVVTEPFRQWVIEDVFCNGRPQWEMVGAEMSTEVASYELMKMRLLNGSHMAMAYLGALNGFTYAHQVIQNSLFYSFIQAFMEEVTPVVPRIKGVSASAYKLSLLYRFSNPTINDQLTRLCSEGSAKLPKWVLPSINDLLQKGRQVRLLSLVVASWFVYLRDGHDRNGVPLNIVDARCKELREAAAKSAHDPRLFLTNPAIFPVDLSRNKNFIDPVVAGVLELSRRSIPEVLSKYLMNE
jgi:mannitol 2-dehydrogenase